MDIIKPTLPPPSAPEPQKPQTVTQSDLIEVDDQAVPASISLNETPASPQKRNREGIKSVISTLAIVILAPLIAFGLTTFIFQSYEVDGASMETTLQHADRLIVLKAPRTWARLTGKDFVPNRGDVIIFNKIDAFETGVSQKKQLVKRVIGLPGDRVLVKDGKVTIYNPQHPDGFEPDKTLPYGNVIQFTPGNIDITVPAGEIYAMGDNRTNSLDSRTFGPVPLEDLVGKLGARIFPFNKFKLF